MDYTKECYRRFGRRNIEWVEGEGRYALLAWCRVLTITLWEDLAKAEGRKAFIDELACGGCCYRHHEIIDLEAGLDGSRYGSDKGKKKRGGEQ